MTRATSMLSAILLAGFCMLLISNKKLYEASQQRDEARAILRNTVPILQSRVDRLKARLNRAESCWLYERWRLMGSFDPSLPSNLPENPCLTSPPDRLDSLEGSGAQAIDELDQKQ